MRTTISAAAVSSVQASLVRPPSTATRPVRQPVLRLALPDELHAGRADHDGGERVVLLDRRERLHRLAEPLLVGDEGAPAAQRVAHARALERVQLAAELQAVQLRVLGVRERDGLGGALELVRELLEQLAGRLLDVDLGVGLDELGELRRERGVGRHGDAPRGVAQEEAARPVHRVRLGQLAEGDRRRAVPRVEDREVRLALLAELKRHLGGRRALAELEQARARGGEIVEADAVELPQERGVLGAEREERAAVAGVGAAVELVGAIALKRPHEEMAPARRGRPPCTPRASGRSRSARRARPGWARGPGTARAAPRPTSRPAGARARASACAASRTSGRAAP